MIKNLASFAAIAAIVLLVGLSYCRASDLSPDKLHKSFNKLNKYLEKTVLHTSDPLVNMRTALDLLDEKTSKKSIFGESSMVEPLRELQSFTKMPQWSSLCGTERGTKMMKDFDAALFDDSRVKTPNYPLTRVDKIVQHYALQIATRCGINDKMNNMNYNFNQNAYDNIDRYLYSSLLANDDVEVNMAKVQEMLNGLKPTDGAIAEAARHILELKSTSTVDSCDEHSYEILLKNDLGTRLKGHQWFLSPLRRLDRIFKHYAKEHAEMCRPILRQKLIAKVSELDVYTYRSVLGMISAHYLDNDDKLNEMTDLLGQKQVSEDFRPLLSNSKDIVLDTEEGVLLKPVEKINKQTLLNYVRAASRNDPYHKYIEEIDDLELVQKFYTKKNWFGKVIELANSYVTRPCYKFIAAVEPLIDADRYSLYQVPNYFTSTKDRIEEELSYHAVHKAYKFCQLNMEDPNIVLDTFGAWFYKNYNIEEPVDEMQEYINNINYRSRD